MRAYIFPGQGSQFPGMGKNLFESSTLAKERFIQANEILGFDITKTMFGDDSEALKETRVTQPAIFLHSTILSEVMSNRSQPEMVAGHSLGEFSALVASGVLSFNDGLSLVKERAMAMQSACDQFPGTMAAILGLEDKVVESVCKDTTGVVIAANYNCPGQIVISGSRKAVSYTHLRAHETVLDLVCRLLLEKKNTRQYCSSIVISNVLFTLLTSLYFLCILFIIFLTIPHYILSIF